MQSLRGVVLLCIAGFLGGALLASVLSHWESAYETVAQPVMHDVDPAAFWKEYSAHPDEYLFIDVRNASQYLVSHAPGAINMPAATLYDQRAYLPRSGKQIGLICGDGRLAAVAYGYLAYYGFTNLVRIQGGLNNWIMEGLPVESGTSTATNSAP